MSTVLITGGTGMIGKALTKALLEKNYAVIVLTRETSKGTRKKVQDSSRLTFAEWDSKKQTIDRNAISKSDYIIHLAGANIGEKRWTKKRKQEIVDSRVKSSELLVKAVKETPNKIKAVISASAIGWYQAEVKENNSRSFRETDPPANDFLGQTCQQWERSIEPMIGLGKRLVKLRTGIVVSNDAGFIPEFKMPLRFGLATILGSGKQIISWIHIDDLVRVYITAIQDENMSGVYNAVAPSPVSNKKFVLQMAGAKRKFFIPVHVPSFVLKIVLGEMSIEVLKSANVSSEKIQQKGFSFQYPTIDVALKQLLL